MCVGVRLCVRVHACKSCSILDGQERQLKQLQHNLLNITPLSFLQSALLHESSHHAQLTLFDRHVLHVLNDLHSTIVSENEKNHETTISANAKLSQ